MYRKNEFIRWFFIPIILYMIIGMILYFAFGLEQDSFWIFLGIASIVNLLLLTPLYIIFNFKVHERVQGIILSAGVIILLTFFTCFTATPFK